MVQKPSRQPKKKTGVSLRWPYLVLAVLTAYLLGLSVFGVPAKTEVKIDLSLRTFPSGRKQYVVTFHLPEGGELTSSAPVVDFVLDRLWGLPTSTSFTTGRFFFSTFCCAEVPSGKYNYLPFEPANEKVTTLVFSNSDGSVWVIPIPIDVLPARDGTITTAAFVYR